MHVCMYVYISCGVIIELSTVGLHSPASRDGEIFVSNSKNLLRFHFLLFKITHNPTPKMQKSSLNYASSTNPSSLSSSSTSPSHSSITTHSLLSSSIDSSSSFQSPSPSRCFGLNLLVKAIHQVTAGSVVGVPYIQRRILTRRRRPLQFNNLILTATEWLSESGSGSKSKSKAKRQRRVNITMPSKYRDSVLQPLTPKLRTERSSSVKITGE